MRTKSGTLNFTTHTTSTLNFDKENKVGPKESREHFLIVSVCGGGSHYVTCYDQAGIKFRDLLGPLDFRIKGM